MSVQEGHQYPNVVRQLQDDGGTNQDSEWWWYDNGGAYPWPGIVTHILTANSTPVRNVSGSTFDLVVNSNRGGEQIYAAVFDSAVDAEDPVTVREGRGALWFGGQASVVGENIFNVTGVTPSGKFYGFAQEDYTPKETIINWTVETQDEFNLTARDMIPTQNEYCLQYVFTTRTDSASAPAGANMMRAGGGTLPSIGTNELGMRRSSNRFEVTLAGSPGSPYIHTNPWNFADAQTIDVRVKLSFTSGLTVWLDGVRVNFPAANESHSGFLTNFGLPAALGYGGALMPITLVKLRMVNEPLSDAAIEAWT